MQAELSQTTQQKTPLVQKIMVAVAMMSVMIGSITAIMTYVNVGFGESFLVTWLSSFILAALVMAPCGMLFMTLISKLVAKVFGHLSKLQQNFVVGMLMAVVMESIMAFSTAINTTEFSNTGLFFEAWLAGFLTALPVGLVIAITMSLTVKPKLEKFMAS